MKTYDFTITSERGLHAQPAAALAAIAYKSDCCVTLTYSDKEIDVSNAIQMMAASIRCQTPVSITVSGPDEDAVMEQLKEVVAAQLL